MSIEIINADVLEGLRQIPDQSVQCVVTSPPYWGLRDYGVQGQIGLEETPEEYVTKMVEVFREIRRVLKDDGTVWLNLGDSYSGSWGDSGHRPDRDGIEGTQREKRTEWFQRNGHPQMKKPPTASIPGLKPKNLVGIPWRVAFALQADGWYLRSDIIWSKPNPMPSSVKDRPTLSHEHIFLLTKKPKYYYDGDAVREPASESYKKDKRPVGVLRQRVNKKSKYPNEGQFKKQDNTGNPTYKGFNARWMAAMGTNMKGHKGLFNAEGKPTCDGLTRNRRTVWTITTQARKEAHFATFPDKIPDICIRAGSRPGDVVLDPFGGSGTTADIARKLGRDAILIELNPEYIKIIRRRLRLDEQLVL